MFFIFARFRNDMPQSKNYSDFYFTVDIDIVFTLEYANTYKRNGFYLSKKKLENLTNSFL